MDYSLFSATGCSRCKIVKNYMDENSIQFNEYNFKADGKEEFNAFYRKNRAEIFRGEEGVEFPILFDGEQVVQGVGKIIAFFKNDTLLDQFVLRSDLSHGWVSGLKVSSGDASLKEPFVSVVETLKASGLKTQIVTDGRNAVILKQLIDKKLVDRLIFNLMGPAEMYGDILGSPLDEEELISSLSCIGTHMEYEIHLNIRPFLREQGHTDVISPEEAGAAASLVEQATATKTHPFFIKNCIPEQEKETLPDLNLFKYRTACRRYMVKSEIFKA